MKFSYKYLLLCCLKNDCQRKCCCNANYLADFHASHRVWMPVSRRQRQHFKCSAINCGFNQLLLTNKQKHLKRKHSNFCIYYCPCLSGRQSPSFISINHNWFCFICERVTPSNTTNDELNFRRFRHIFNTVLQLPPH